MGPIWRRDLVHLLRWDANGLSRRHAILDKFKRSSLRLFLPDTFFDENAIKFGKFKKRAEVGVTWWEKITQKKIRKNKSTMSGRGKGGKGLGMGGAKRHRKVIRDSIQGLTKPAIRRLVQRGGIPRLSGLVYEETRGVTKVFLENIIRDAVTATEHARRKTVQEKDVQFALERQGKFLGAAVSERGGGEVGVHVKSSGKAAAPKALPVVGTKKAASKKSKKPTPAVAGGIKKPHRFHPGTVALREVRKMQKYSGPLIPFLPFSRLVREIAQDFVTDLRFEKKAILLLRLITEDYLVGLFEDCAVAVVHGGRQTLEPKDIQVVRRIRGERS